MPRDGRPRARRSSSRPRRSRRARSAQPAVAVEHVEEAVGAAGERIGPGSLWWNASKSPMIPPRATPSRRAELGRGGLVEEPGERAVHGRDALRGHRVGHAQALEHLGDHARLLGAAHQEPDAARGVDHRRGHGEPRRTVGRRGRDCEAVLDAESVAVREERGRVAVGAEAEQDEVEHGHLDVRPLQRRQGAQLGVVGLRGLLGRRPLHACGARWRPRSARA